jgi:uncharacterized membrane protein
MFGIFMISISILIIFQMEELQIPMPGESNNPRGPIIALIILCILIISGVSSIYFAISKTLILRAKPYDGASEVLELTDLKKNNELVQLDNFLNHKLPNYSRSINNKNVL